MQTEARVLCQPGLDVGVLVGLVVVYDQMQVELRRELAVQRAQELEELLVAVTGQALADDAAVERLRAANRVVVPLRL